MDINHTAQRIMDINHTAQHHGHQTYCTAPWTPIILHSTTLKTSDFFFSLDISFNEYFCLKFCFAGFCWIFTANCWMLDGNLQILACPEKCWMVGNTEHEWIGEGSPFSNFFIFGLPQAISWGSTVCHIHKRHSKCCKFLVFTLICG